MVEGIERVLGEPLAKPRSVWVDAEIDVVLEGEEYTLTSVITTESGSRTRTLRTTDCSELAEITALLVAVAIDPGVRIPVELPSEEPPDIVEEPPSEPVVETDPAPVEPTEPQPTVPAEPDPPTEPPPAKTERLGFAARIGTGLSLGVLPGPAALLHPKVALTRGLFRAELGLTHRFSRRTAAVNAAGAHAEIWSTAGELSLCVAPGVPRVDFPVCGGFEAGTLAGRSHGVVRSALGRGIWAAFRLGAGLIVMPWRRVGIFVDADAIVPVTRTGFAVDGIGDVYRVGPVAGELAVGLEVALSR